MCVDERQLRESISDELGAVRGCYIHGVDLENKIDMLEKPAKRANSGRPDISLMILRYKGRLVYYPVYNVSTTSETSTSYKWSTDGVSNATAELEELRERRSRRGKLVVSNPVN